MTYTPGPGDILGQYTGHPHDPRTPEDDSNDTTEEAIVDVFEYIADALNAYRKNDRAEYDRVLRKAVTAINTMLGQ